MGLLLIFIEIKNHIHPAAQGRPSRRTNRNERGSGRFNCHRMLVGLTGDQVDGAQDHLTESVQIERATNSSQT